MDEKLQRIKELTQTESSQKFKQITIDFCDEFRKCYEDCCMEVALAHTATMLTLIMGALTPVIRSAFLAAIRVGAETMKGEVFEDVQDMVSHFKENEAKMGELGREYLKKEKETTGHRSLMEAGFTKEDSQVIDDFLGVIEGFFKGRDLTAHLALNMAANFTINVFKHAGLEDERVKEYCDQLRVGYEKLRAMSQT